MKTITVLLGLLLLAPLSFAQQTYPAGTAFEESFGNGPLTEDCWSTTTLVHCYQLWAVTAGTGKAIVTAPTGWTGNALEMPAAATALSLSAYGTFPTIPANSGFTLTLTAQAAGTSANYDTVILLEDSSGNIEAQFMAENGGWNENSVGPHCGISTQASTLKVVMNGASSAFYVDGTQCGTNFTDPGHEVSQIIVQGNTEYTMYVQQITLNGTTVTGGWPPSAFIDWAGQSGTATAASVFAGIHCGNVPNASNVTITSLTGVSFAFASMTTPAFGSPLTLCGASYSGNSNVALQMSVTTTANSAGYVQLQFYGTTYSNISIGFYFKFSAKFDACDFIAIGAGSYTKIDNLQLFNNAGNEVIHAESDSGSGTGTSNSTTVPLATGTWYYATFNISSTGVTYVYIYDASGHAVDDVAFPATLKYAGPGPVYVQFGKVGNETQTESGTISYANIQVSYADAPFPLLPPASLAGPTQPGLFAVGP